MHLLQLKGMQRSKTTVGMWTGYHLSIRRGGGGGGGGGGVTFSVKRGI